MSRNRLTFVAPVVLLAILLCGPARPSAAADRSLVLLPGDFSLLGPAARQRLVVGEIEKGQFVGQPGGKVTLSSSDEHVVRIRDGVALAAGDGSATITARVGSQSQNVRVTVTGFGTPMSWSFRNHVEPVLAKFGCSTGACHGALAGKGGFKLSLLGYNPMADHETITRQASGRRIDLSDPGRSLILMKPTVAIHHKGGVRFDVDSREYRVLSEWIAAGAPAPRDDDPRLARLEILPSSSLLKPGAEQQFLVRAHFSDGRVEDVTDWVRFSATNEAVAKVDQQGRSSVVGYGEGAITAWYLSHIVIAHISSPYPNRVPPEVIARAQRRNFIDELVLKKLQELNLPPSPRCCDAEFLRRVFLDTIGTLPTADEARVFLAEKSPDKRDRLIEALLARPEFVDYWTYKWSDLLLVNGKRLSPDAVATFHAWIRQRVAANTPWDKLVRAVITATGTSTENGATSFYALHELPEEMTENVSQAFLGLSIGCARCHNHPLEKWTNDQYYAMANLFARVRSKGSQPGARVGSREVYVVDSGDLIQPSTGKAQPPTPLDGQPLAFDAPQDRRIALARWLTAPENPYFARSITNRVWANFFGVGLVEKVDDMRTSNPASNEMLLSAAAAFLVEHKYDLKALMRAILQSEAYQRTSLALAENREENRFYSRYYPRRLMAEVLLDAVCQVTGVPEQYNRIAARDGSSAPTKSYPSGTRALQLADSAVVSPFLKTFGRNEREVACECARSNEPSIVQVLNITNGGTINQKLEAKKGRLAALLAANTPDAKILDEAYLSSLARYPTAVERKELLKMLDETPGPEKQQALEDIYWGILSSREFLFNH